VFSRDSPLPRILFGESAMSTQLTLLQNRQQFLEVVTTDGDIRAILESKRVPIDDLATGLTMISGVKELYARREGLLGVQMGLTGTVETEYAEVRALMAQLRYTAEIELAGRPDLLAKIGLHKAAKGPEETSPPSPPAPVPPAAGPTEPAPHEADGPRSIARFISVSEPFVANVLGSAEILAALGEGSFSREDVASLAERLEALRRTNVEQEKAVGATRSATRALRTADDRLTVWYRPRRRRVTRALKGRVDLKKRLGLAA